MYTCGLTVYARGHIGNFRTFVALDVLRRALAPELAGRYVELAGGSAEVAATLATAVTAAIDRLSSGAAPHSEVGLAFTPNAGGIHVDLSCGTLRESVNVTIPVVKR